jgi:hypothetical protein
MKFFVISSILFIAGSSTQRIAQANGDLILLSHLEIFATAVNLQENTLFVGAGNRLVIYNISDPFTPQKISEYDGFYSDVVDIEFKSEYLYLSLGPGGFSVFDVHDKSQPQEVAHYAGTFYDSVVENNLILLANWDYGVQLYDIRDGSSPKLISDQSIAKKTSSIYSTGEWAYVTVAKPNSNVGGSSGVDLYSINVTDPFSPALGSSIPLSRSVLGMDVYKDNLYLANYAWGLTILDLHSPSQPKIIDNFGQYGLGDLAIDEQYLYFLEYQSGNLIVWDISSSPSYVETGKYQFRNGLSPIGLDIDVNDAFVIVSNRDDGVYIFNHSIGKEHIPPTPSLTVFDNRLEDLLSRKEKTIKDLSYTSYQTSLLNLDISTENIHAFDENLAQSLVDKMRSANPDDISAEEIDAFNRLVLQEETINEVLENYSTLNNYYTDIIIDFASISQSGFLLIKAYISPAEALSGLVQKTFLDWGRLLAAEIPDAEWREATINSIESFALFSPFDPGFDGIYSQGEIIDMTESVYTSYTDPLLRKKIASENIAYFIRQVQSSIDIGVISVENPENGWALDGDVTQAEFRASTIATLSQTTTQERASRYINYSRGVGVNEILTDLVDIISVGTKHPYSVVFSLWLRIQKAAIDQIAMYEILSSMECLTQAAIRTGEITFQPSPGTLSCDQLLDAKSFHQIHLVALNEQFLSIPQTDGILHFGQDANELASALSYYHTVLQDLKIYMEEVNKDQVEKSYGELLLAQGQVNNYSTEILNTILPKDIDRIPSQNIQIAGRIVEMELNQVGLYLAIEWYLDEPESIDAIRFAMQAIEETSSSVDILKSELEQLLSSIDNNDAIPPLPTEDRQVDSTDSEDQQIHIDYLVVFFALVVIMVVIMIVLGIFIIRKVKDTYSE